MTMEMLSSLVVWLGKLPFSQWIGQSTHRIFFLFALHIFGIVFLLGGMVFLSLRLVGLLLPTWPMRELSHAALPAIDLGLILMVGSGALLFLGGAEAYFAGEWFRLKMLLLMVALSYHFAIYRRVSTSEEGCYQPATLKTAALVALLLWFGVGWCGRMIAFS